VCIAWSSGQKIWTQRTKEECDAAGDHLVGERTIVIKLHVSAGAGPIVPLCDQGDEADCDRYDRQQAHLNAKQVARRVLDESVDFLDLVGLPGRQKVRHIRGRGHAKDSDQEGVRDIDSDEPREPIPRQDLPDHPLRQ
jgi:hypothetical protein